MTENGETECSPSRLCYPPSCDDDVPLTAEWIWQHVSEYRVSERCSRNAVNTAEFRFCRDGGYCALESDLGYGSDIDIRTRGDVRKLCDVLGIHYQRKI